MFSRSFFLVAAGSIATFIACSDNKSQPAPTPEAGAVCPQSPKNAVGKPCSPEGYSCAVGYLCPTEVWQQAHCTCTKGTYACTDSMDQPVAAGTDPECTPVTVPSEKCMTAPVDIRGKVCTTAGYACYYTGVTCPNQNGGKPFTDDCVCAPAGALTDGGPNVLTWHCSVATCL